MSSRATRDNSVSNVSAVSAVPSEQIVLNATNCEVENDQHCNRWNIPDWRQAHRYPELESYQARWEFLRRNPKYRGDWELCSQGLFGQKDAAGNTVEERIAWNYGLFEMIDPSLRAEQVGRHVFVEGETFLTELEFEQMRNEWLARACGSTVMRVPGEKRRGRRAAQANSMHSFQARVKARGHILVAIDPELLLENAIRNIKSALPKRTSTKRVRSNQFPLLLRILDARSGDREDVVPFEALAKFIDRNGLEAEQLKRKCSAARRYLLTACRPFSRDGNAAA